MKNPTEPNFTGPIILLSLGAVLAIIGLVCMVLEHQYEASHPKTPPTLVP